MNSLNFVNPDQPDPSSTSEIKLAAIRALCETAQEKGSKLSRLDDAEDRRVKPKRGRQDKLKQ